MKIKGLWFFGISSSGKSFLSKFLKKKIKNSILLDGDDIRKFISFDLSYSISDRVIQTKRMLGFAEICIKNRLFPIISTAYLNKKVYLNVKKRGILVVKVEREKNKTNLKLKNKKNVVGINITLPKFKCLVIKNTNKKFKKKFFEQLKKKNYFLN